MSAVSSPRGASPIRELSLGVLDVGAFPLSVALAPGVEALGYQRFWLAEHHGERATTNPTLAVPLIAGLTRSMRVGTAGVLLRFQSALSVAESHRMLQHVFAGRIDLGLARGQPPHATLVTRLLDGRPDAYSAADHAAKVADVQALLCGRPPLSPFVPDALVEPPLTDAGPPQMWVLSTSPSGAELAAKLGSHYSFHDHYNPRQGPDAVKQYVAEFRPSPEVAEPSWNVCIAGYCAESAEEAKRIERSWFATSDAGRRQFVGTRDEWRLWLREIAESYGTPEVIVQTLFGVYDAEQQLASFARIAEVARTLA